MRAVGRSAGVFHLTRGYTSVTFSESARRARREVARVPLGLAKGAPRLGPVASGSRWRDTMSKKSKPTVPQRPAVVVIKIDLRKVRWIEPRRGSGDWWPVAPR
jgi:hypothetical protein